MQKGKCKSCQVPISFQYPLVELTTGILSALAVYQFGISAQSGFYLLFAYALIALFVIDSKHQLLSMLLLCHCCG
ncbi:A24 family peptidase [Abyssogena phaseoliformis symbiont]|uniref:prepilin peptidase n=1 Tax=Abyssogena phaseoliformis symbiont TaxID=596095 RepID=UPI001916BC51